MEQNVNFFLLMLRLIELEYKQNLWFDMFWR